MPDRAAISPAFQDALDKQDFDRVEELWLESLDRDRIRVDELLEVRRLIFQAGRKNLAMTLLDLLVDTLEGRDDPFQTMAALREQVRLVGKPDAALVARLQKALAATRADSPSLDAVVSRYPLTSQKKTAEAIKNIENWLNHDTGTIVEVMGQGVGTVTELNLELDNIKVDLGGRRPVSVPFGAVARYLRPLPEGDFRRRNVEDAETLTAFALDNPGQALVELIESLGQDVSVSAIKTGLADVVPEKNWTSWWNKARKHPRILTSGTGSRLRYSISDSAEDATNVLLNELEEADPRQRLTIAKRLASRGDEASDEANRILAASIEAFDDEPGLAWETATALGALPGGQEDRRRSPRHDRQRRPTPPAPEGHPGQAGPDGGPRCHPRGPTRRLDDNLGRVAPAREHTGNSRHHRAALDRAGAADSLDAAIEAVFRNHVQHATQFIWACERMTNPDSPEPIRRRMTPSLLEKIPDGLSRREFASLRGRCKALLDGGKVAIRLLLESANEGQAQRFAQRIARLPGVEPQRVSLVEQAAHQAHGSTQPEDEGPLLVATQAAIDAQRAELKQLLEVEIPKTLKGINAAAAEGDLRENFEYHMLRDRQELQSARAAKLQRELREVRTLEPGKADTDRVNIGTVVHFEGETEPLTILGVWDADVDRRVFANGSGLAEALLGRTVGDEVEIEGKVVTIASIEAWQG